MSDEEQADEAPNRCTNKQCRRVLTEGWTLCEYCTSRLADDLLEVADRYHKLTAAPAMQPGRYDRSGSNKPGSKPPLNLNVVVMRDARTGSRDAGQWTARDGKVHHEDEDHAPPSVLRELGRWTGALAEHLGYSHMPNPNVDDVVAWLNRQSEPIAKWWQAGVLVAAVRILRNRLRSANHDANERPVGACIVDIDRHGETRACGAPVFMPRPEPGVSPAAWCQNRSQPHEYDFHALNRLKVHREQEAEAKEQAEQAATEEAAS